MSMYSQLLRSALDGAQPAEGGLTTGDALAHLLRARSQLGWEATDQDGGDGTYVTVANHLAYDAALIELSRLLGVECGAEEFDQPDRARARLERALSANGIPLHEIEVPAPGGREET